MIYFVVESWYNEYVEEDMAMKHGGYDDDSAQGLEALRQDVIDRLTEAFSADAISMEEYELRATQANTMSSLEELERLSYDLPSTRQEPGKPQYKAKPSPETHTGTDSSLIGARPITIGSIMGDRNMTGNWLSSDRVSSFTVMGSTKLDLRDVDLPPGPVRIEVYALMGETKVIVPRGLPVRLNVFAFMGESRASRDVNQQLKGATSWIEISGIAMMGSVNVKALD